MNADTSISNRLRSDQQPLLNNSLGFAETMVHDQKPVDGLMNLLIVEDSELIRTQILRLLSVRPEVSVIGMTGDEDFAVSVILSSRPDAVLLDLALASGSGFQVLKRIRAAGSTSRVLVISGQSGEALRNACESLGIAGFYDMNLDMGKCLGDLFSWLPPASNITAAGDSAAFRMRAP